MHRSSHRTPMFQTKGCRGSFLALLWIARQSQLHWLQVADYSIDRGLDRRTVSVPFLTFGSARRPAPEDRRSLTPCTSFWVIAATTRAGLCLSPNDWIDPTPELENRTLWFSPYFSGAPLSVDAGTRSHLYFAICTLYLAGKAIVPRHLF
jgi:hypothetical protein